MLEIVAAHDVKLGMFVAELDRPWLGTPFALQGFLVSNPQQIAALKEYCSFVSVDRSKSVYKEFAPLPVAAPRTGVSRGQAMVDLFRSVSGSEVPDGRPLIRRPLPVQVGVTESEPHAPPRSGPPLPRGTVTQVPARPRRYQMPVQGRIEAVPGKSLRPNLQPNRAALAEIEQIVEKSHQHLLHVPQQTVYIDRSSVEEEMLASTGAFARTQELMLDVSLELAKDKLPQPERIREAVDEMVQSMVRNPDAMIWLSKLKRSDNYSYDHALDVSIHLMAFGRHLGLPLGQLNVLGVAGLLQDVGKASVPIGLLQKIGALTPPERAVLRRHVEFSTQILASQAGLPLDVIQIAARHHERYDGSGYPRRLAGGDIGLSAEMAGLVDTYCAMSYDRPYRRGLDNEHVLRKLYASRGRRFSEPLIIEFIQCVGLYPVGTLVEMRSGEVAVVVEQNRVRRLKPRILVLLGKDKQALESPLALDLKDEPLSEDGNPYQIRHALQAGAYGIEPREFYL